MLVRVAQRHKRKIAIGLPALFLLVMGNVAVFSGGNTFVLSCPTPFVEVDSIIPINVHFSTHEDINAMGGTLLYPTSLLFLDTVGRSSSALDLWTEEPTFSNNEGTMRWSGGVLLDDGDGGALPREGVVLTAEFVTRSPGIATLSIADGKLLAANGLGENRYERGAPLRVFIRAKGSPTPDVNGDGKLGVADVNTVYFATFGTYDPRYDLNGDGKISWADVRTLFSLL